jgi:hypothetical protein
LFRRQAGHEAGLTGAPIWAGAINLLAFGYQPTAADGWRSSNTVRQFATVERSRVQLI